MKPKFQSKNFITIQGWMITDLKLSGTDLVVYAIIHGFSQDGQSLYSGGISYLQTATNTSKNTVIKSLKLLTEKEFLIKEELFLNGVRFCNYKSNRGGAETALGVQNNALGGAETALGGGAETEPNIYNNNIYNNLMSEIKISDVAQDMQIYFNCAEAFRKLFVKIAQREGLPTKIYDKAKYKDYVTPIRLAVEADGYTIEQIRQAYNYLNSSFDNFWYKNIRSAKKLRQQLDKLVLEFNKVNKTA